MIAELPQLFISISAGNPGVSARADQSNKRIYVYHGCTMERSAAISGPGPYGEE
jgi:hypothetical protein